MGNIVIENIKVMDMISGQIIQDPDYLSSIQIEEEEDQEAFYIFLYCSSALRVSTFKLPYDANDLDGYQLTQVPDCRHCDFKDSNRWEENTSNEKQQFIETAFNHPTLLYKKLNKRGQLINTTYLEMLKSHKTSYNCDNTLFASGSIQKCTHCNDEHNTLVINPSLEELRIEEKDNELMFMSFFMENKAKMKIYITEKMKEKYLEDLEKCLSYKKFEDIKRALSISNCFEEVYKRLLTPKMKTHLKTFSVPYKYRRLKDKWEEFLGVKPVK